MRELAWKRRAEYERLERDKLEQMVCEQRITGLQKVEELRKKFAYVREKRIEELHKDESWATSEDSEDSGGFDDIPDVNEDIIIDEDNFGSINITGSSNHTYVDFPLVGITIYNLDDRNIIPQFELPQLDDSVYQDIKSRLDSKLDKLKPENIVFFKLLSYREEERLPPEEIYQLPDSEIIEILAKYELEESIGSQWVLIDLDIIKDIKNRNTRFVVNDNIYYFSDEQWDEIDKRLTNNNNGYNSNNLMEKQNFNYQKVMFIDKYFSQK